MKGNHLKGNAGGRNNNGRGMGYNRRSSTGRSGVGGRNQGTALWILSLSLIAIYFLIGNFSGYNAAGNGIFLNIVLLAGILLLIAAVVNLFNRRK